MDDERRARGLDHVAVAVRDADVATRWYADALGLQVRSDEYVPAAGVRLVYLVTDPAADTALQLVQPTAPGTVADFLAVRGEGLHHVCFAVPDVEATLDALGESADGVFAGGRGRRCCFLTGTPEGVRVELTETAAAGPVLPWSSHAPSIGTGGPPCVRP